MKISFGTDDKKRLTGAGIYVKIFQVSSLVLACCMLLASQFPPVMLQRGLFSALFDLAAMSLPRAWVWLLSGIYRASSKETILFFALLVKLRIEFLSDYVGWFIHLVSFPPVKKDQAPTRQRIPCIARALNL